MSTAEKKFIRLGQRDYEIGSQAHLDAVEAEHKSAVAELQKKLDETTGKLDAAEQAVTAAKREKDEMEAKAADDEKARSRDLASRVKSRVRLLMRAIRLFGEDEEEEDEEKKMDALADLSERDIHLKAIKKADPDFKADGKSDDYIAGKFEGVVEYLAKSRGVDGVVSVLEGGHSPGARLDARDGSRSEHPVAKARRENLERMNKIAEPASAREGGAR